jgi:chromosomal replication initiation ATPase DnaA
MRTTINQIPLPLPHHDAMGADDFLVTPSNRDAMAWIGKWPDWPAHGVIVSGGTGSGKTHLLNLWLAKSGARLVTVADLAANDAATLAAPDTLVAIDDADTAAGNQAAEETLFHLYNHINGSNGSLLLSMTRGAGRAGFILPDLRSRLLTLPVAALAAPDDDLLSALILKQFRDRQVDLDAGVVSYVTARAARDAGGIRDLVAKLDRAALAEGRRISIGLARQVMESQAMESQVTEGHDD